MKDGDTFLGFPVKVVDHVDGPLPGLKLGPPPVEIDSEFLQSCADFAALEQQIQRELIKQIVAKCDREFLGEDKP